MSFALKLFAANLTSLAAVIGATVLAYAGIAGWGWFLAVALFTASNVKSTDTTDETTDA